MDNEKEIDLFRRKIDIPPNIINDRRLLRRPNEATKIEDPLPKETNKENKISAEIIRYNNTGGFFPYTEPSCSTTSSMKSASKQLNHDAVEFQPTPAPKLPPVTTYKSLQNRLRIKQGLPVEEFEEQKVHQYQEELVVQDQEPIDIPTEEELIAVELIENIANLLSEEPGNFDDFSEQIQNTFKDFYGSEYVISISMETIFKRSIEDSNFRFTGAKLYKLLDKLQHREQSRFRNLLDCKLSFLKTEIEEQIKNEEFEITCGTLLFLSELYMQLRLDSIANSILYGINTLLSVTPVSKISKDTIKSICFTLKLSGYYLEQKFPKMVLMILNKLIAFPKYNQTIQLLVENIVDFQINNWGRRDSVSSNDFLDCSPAVCNDEPTFYGPDGEVLTEEESIFLNSQQENDSDYEFDEMGNEEGIDFRKFLYTSKKN